MKITVKKIDLKENLNRNHRKENNFYSEITLFSRVKNKYSNNKIEIKPIITLRNYSTNSTNYCCVWISDFKSNVWASGSGKASGYGYHRESGAAESALNACGIEFSTYWGGSGDGSIIDALEAIANKLGYKNFFIHKAHA